MATKGKQPKAKPRTEPEAGAGEPPAGEGPEPSADPTGEAEWAEDELILLAARGMVLFPRVVLPIVVGRERSVRAIQDVKEPEKAFSFQRSACKQKLTADG